MISFNLTALTQPTLSIQRKSKTRHIFPKKPFRISPNFHSYFQSSTKTVALLQNLVYSITALKHFKKRAFAHMTTTFRIEEDEEPMATEPIYLSSDESEYSTANTTPDHQLECIHPDSINQLVASQLEQRSNMGAETIVYPPTPNTSIISAKDDPMNPTPIIGNPDQSASDPTQTPSPNTTLPTCATYPRYAAISNPGRSWAVRRLLSRQYPTTQPTQNCSSSGRLARPNITPSSAP